MKLRRLVPFAFLPILASPLDSREPLSSFFTPSSNVVELSDESNVKYSEKAVGNFLHVYLGLKREIPFCQYGYLQGEKIFVYDVNMPIMLSSRDRGTEFIKFICQKDRNYVGMVHNHYDENPCKLSNEDNRRFGSDKLAKIETIVCKTYPDSGIVELKTKVK